MYLNLTYLTINACMYMCMRVGGFRTVVADAVWAAYRRALELGDNNPNVSLYTIYYIVLYCMIVCMYMATLPCL